MRIYEDCYQLASEIRRDVYEMGSIVKPKSMQNKIVDGDINYETKEILNYSYCLQTLRHEEMLFIDKVSKEWCDAEFNERVSTFRINPGNAWLLRKEVWEEFLDKDSQEFDYTYGDRLNVFPNHPYGGPPYGPGILKRVVKELVNNPDTRQAILAIWDTRIDSSRIGGVRRVPCSMYYQVIIRGNKVHLIYNQRSCDIVTHFGNDVYLAWKLKEYIKDEVNKLRNDADDAYESGYLYHNIASLHAYRKDWETLKRCITEDFGKY